MRKPSQIPNLGLEHRWEAWHSLYMTVTWSLCLHLSCIISLYLTVLHTSFFIFPLLDNKVPSVTHSVCHVPTFKLLLDQDS